MAMTTNTANALAAAVAPPAAAVAPPTAMVPTPVPYAPVPVAMPSKIPTPTPAPTSFTTTSGGPIQVPVAQAPVAASPSPPPVAQAPTAQVPQTQYQQPQMAPQPQMMAPGQMAQYQQPQMAPQPQMMVPGQMMAYGQMPGQMMPGQMMPGMQNLHVTPVPPPTAITAKANAAGIPAATAETYNNGKCIHYRKSGATIGRCNSNAKPGVFACKSHMNNTSVTDQMKALGISYSPEAQLVIQEHEAAKAAKKAAKEVESGTSTKKTTGAIAKINFDDLTEKHTIVLIPTGGKMAPYKETFRLLKLNPKLVCSFNAFALETPADGQPIDINLATNPAPPTLATPPAAAAPTVAPAVAPAPSIPGAPIAATAPVPAMPKMPVAPTAAAVAPAMPRATVAPVIPGMAPAPVIPGMAPAPVMPAPMAVPLPNPTA